MLAFIASKDIGKTMANLSIRKLDEAAYKQLQIRAEKHGVSMEEEARQIIYHAVSTSEKMDQIFQKHFGHKNGVNLKLEHRKPHRPLDFK